MNIHTARKLDYYAGIPLCAIGTVIKKISPLFSRRKDCPETRNVLFIELSEMGSTILADPAMIKVKNSLNARLFFVIFERNRASLELLNTVAHERIFSIRDSGLLSIAMDTARFFLWTRRNKIDTVIDLELFSRFTALLAGFSGAVRTVGFHAFYNEGLYRGDFLTHKVAYNPHQHIAKNFIALVNALLSRKEEVPYSKTLIPDEEILLRKIEVAEAEKAAMHGKIGSAVAGYVPGRDCVVLFNTDASELMPLRRWPQEHFIRLAQMVLGKYPRVIILLTGDASERQGKDAIVREVNNERCINFAGCTSIAELPALYSISSLMLTNDSGPAHFASVTDLSLFVLYGPETPNAYGALGNLRPIYAGMACSPCVSATNHRKSPCTDNRCLQVITPERVFEALVTSLDTLP